MLEKISKAIKATEAIIPKNFLASFVSPTYSRQDVALMMIQSSLPKWQFALDILLTFGSLSFLVDSEQNVGLLQEFGMKGPSRDTLAMRSTEKAKKRMGGATRDARGSTPNGA